MVLGVSIIGFALVVASAGKSSFAMVTTLVGMCAGPIASLFILGICFPWIKPMVIIMTSSYHWPFVGGIHRSAVDSLHRGPVMLGFTHTYINSISCSVYDIATYDIISYHTLYCIVSYHIISYHIMSCHVMSCHVMSCHIIYLIISSYRIISYHIISNDLLIFVKHAITFKRPHNDANV